MSELNIETETGSPIESGIEEDWSDYAYIDDGEYAVVIGVRWADEDPETDHPNLVHWSMYFCEAGLVNRVRSVNSWDFDHFNNLADAAKQILAEIAEQDDREPLEAVREYWNQPAEERETY